MRARTESTTGAGLDVFQSCTTIAGVACYQYDLDGAGNRTKQTITGSGVANSTTTYTVNDANQLTGASTGSTTGSYTYDRNGNQLTGGGNTFAWNIRDQMSTFNGAAQKFLGAGQDLRVADGAVSLRNSVLGVADRATTTGRTAYVHDDRGAPVMQHNLNRGYYLTDALGSITGFTNDSGTLTGSWRYDPYGNPTSGSPTSNGVFLGFAGGYTDKGSVVHFGQRFYDPRVGRWTQRDPIDQLGDLKEGNPYVYVGADPLNFVDPLGQDARAVGRVACQTVFPGVGAAAGAAAGAALGGGAGAACAELVGDDD